MSNIPPRPKADKVMILAACTLVAEKINGDAETIAKHYRRHMDGFELAKELDKYASWDTTRDDMDALDEVDYGRIEAILSMGGSPWHVIAKALLPEALPTLLAGITLTVAQTSGLKDGDAATVVDAVAGDVQLGTVVVSGRLELIADDIQLYPGQMIRLTTSAVIPAGRAARSPPRPGCRDGQAL